MGEGVGIIVIIGFCVGTKVGIGIGDLVGVKVGVGVISGEGKGEIFSLCEDKTLFCIYIFSLKL